jgi:hypothetical protein
MRVPVAYASRHGATRGIAERVAKTLESAGRLPWGIGAPGRTRTATTNAVSLTTTSRSVERAPPYHAALRVWFGRDKGIRQRRG